MIRVRVRVQIPTRIMIVERAATMTAGQGWRVVARAGAARVKEGGLKGMSMEMIVGTLDMGRKDRRDRTRGGGML